MAEFHNLPDGLENALADDRLRLHLEDQAFNGARIKVIGVGGGGSNAVNRMIRAGFDGVEFIVANTDLQALKASAVPTRLQIGSKLTKGLGAGADPQIGRSAALEDTDRILQALDGAEHTTRAGLAEALVPVEPVAATRADLERVHPVAYLDRIEGISAAGGGRLDPDTYASPGSWNAAVLAAGAGLTAVEALRRGEAASAFCAVRPPGHHATAHESMGFCFVNNVAVVAASLADQGERVMVFDFDAHHGNGTNDIFYADPRVLFVSIHQWPLYPGTGRHDEIGVGAGRGYTVNIPVPPGATEGIEHTGVLPPVWGQRQFGTQRVVAGHPMQTGQGGGGLWAREHLA